MESRPYVYDLTSANVLQAALAEYAALRSEIEYRSESENRMIQIHVTAMTLILGVALTQQLGGWVVALIPIESSLLGMWFMVHSTTIMEIGSYLKDVLRPKIAAIVEDNEILAWEDFWRVVAAERPSRGATRVKAARWVITLTFAAPSAFALVVTFVLLVLGFDQFGAIGSDLPSRTQLEWWIMLAGWIGGAALFLFYLQLERQRWLPDVMQ